MSNRGRSTSKQERAHVHHLIVAYANGQLTSGQQRRVMRHIQNCADCRAAVDQQQHVADDLHTFMPRIGTPARGQLKALYPQIWAQTTRRSRLWFWRFTVLPAYGMALTMLLIACVLIGSALFLGPSHAVASPMSPADVKATWTPIFTGEPTKVAENQPLPEASLTAPAYGVDLALPASPAPIASVMP
ncbi:MAG: zf-HC2 domain-containing protein [Anaerolineae bacterium]|nr:zf-HC2 domain-containing protein [Anaerolineae bacterium]